MAAHDAYIEAPSEATFRASFEGITPPVSYIESSLGRTAYYVLGKGSGSPSTQSQPDEIPYIFIHGICTPSLGMLGIANQLLAKKDQCTIVLFDVWGHGLSSSPNQPHTPELVHQQINGIMSRLKWNSAHLLGYSLGGSVSVSFAASHPQAVRSLFLIGPAGLIERAEIPSSITDDDLSQTLSSTRDLNEELKARKRIFDWLEGDSTINVPSDWKESIAKGQLVAPALRQWQLDNHKGHLGSCASLFRNGIVLKAESSFKKVTSSTSIPIFACLGEIDELSTVEKMERVGVHNHFVVPNATHGLARDNTPEVVETLVKFLNSIL